ncbi:MAG: Re/Si-specific NAD(P)(+) transhydrogenase subunit alpha [Phycisphaerae bacterium]|nr:Re/Si-specific NAD(P)(+) transhydrogenase subunit alpha [Phycisphaerae bacterium]NUQ48056.1 Re/Si-specific NAD(P)(+) transhydrogenase subunit alpha [Phycisphaerae bacterium]
MIIGVPRETCPGERRVALVPAVLAPLKKLGAEAVIERGAGLEAGFTDEEYHEKGARLAGQRDDVFAEADIVAQVRALGANPEAGRLDLPLLRRDQSLIGMCEPLTAGEVCREAAERGVNLFSMELIPRITRAQSMDVLSSQATVAGYKAVLLAADALPRMFPMLMTAAGTVAPARVFVIGAGVAGLQAIATARRLGAVVSGYDVRPAVKEQVESLGAKFVEMKLETGAAEDKGGYARAMGEEFYRKQRELMTEVVKHHDVVITTAVVPGKKAPVLLTAEMVRGMAPGSVIVDLAAERGGNCELTRPGETVVEGGVTILGPANLPAMVPYHASQMYAQNIVNFLKNLVKDNAIRFEANDEIIRETLVTRGGQVVHPRVKELLGASPAMSGAGA